MNGAVATAIRAAETRYLALETARRRAQLVADAHRLAARGATVVAIADELKMSETNALRLCHAEPDWPATESGWHLEQSKQRAADLATMADQVCRLAAMLRDQDPVIVLDALSRLDAATLREVAAVALAAIPTDRSKHELFAWTGELA